MGTSPFSFATVHYLDLQERELEVGEAFDDTHMPHDSDDDEEESHGLDHIVMTDPTNDPAKG